MASIVNKYHLITTQRLDEMKEGLRNLPVKEGNEVGVKSDDIHAVEVRSEIPMEADEEDEGDDELDEVESAVAGQGGGQAVNNSLLAGVSGSVTSLIDDNALEVDNSSAGAGVVNVDSESNDSGTENSFDEMNKFNASMAQARSRIQKSRDNYNSTLKSKRAKVEEEWISF